MSALRGGHSRRSAFDPVQHRAEVLTGDRIAAENYF
jgi:hypothetical protein